MNSFCLFAFAAVLLSSLVTRAASLNLNLPKGLCTDEVKVVEKEDSDHIDQMRLAVCLHNNHHPATMDLYNHIRSTNPDYAYVLVNLGVLKLKDGDLDSAREYFQQYLKEVGGAYGDEVPVDRLAMEVGTPCRKDSPTIQKNNCVNALNNLGALEFTAGQNSTAATYYLSRAVEIGDEHMLDKVYANLGGHLYKIGDDEGAADAFIKGFWVNMKLGLAGDAVGLLVRRAFVIPSVSSSIEESDYTHINLQHMINDITTLATHGGSEWLGGGNDLFRTSNGISTIEDIRRIPPLSGTLSDWTNQIQLPHFYAHYKGWHDKPLNEAVADMFAVLCPDSLFEIADHLVKKDESAPRRKKKIAFVSSQMGGDEPHGLLVLDIMKSLQNLFDFYVVSIGSKPLTKDFYSNAIGVYEVGYNEFQASDILKSLELDALVYCESLNSAPTYFLSFQRFAEVQILVMGAPVTSGIPSFDYFVSGDMLEHPFRTQLVDDHYSEQVVLFDGQAISFPRTSNELKQDSLMAAGDAAVLLSNQTSLEQMAHLQHQDSHIYMCFQSIQKMQPSFDHVLIDIIVADPLAHLVLQASRHSKQTETLQRRLQINLKERLCGNEAISCSAMKKAYGRIHFLPRVKSDEVLDLIQKATVVLHPFPFGGSKTASDVINAGIPLVTYPQAYLRGRMAAAFIKSMALEEVDPDLGSCCIASSPSDYVTKAIRLASDDDYRSRVVQAIQQRSDRIFDDKSVSFEWGRLLTRALQVRISDEEIQANVGFVPQARHQDEYIAKAMEDEQARWRRSVGLAQKINVQ